MIACLAGALFSAAAGSASTGAQSAEERFDAGEAAYLAGDALGALQIFAAIVDDFPRSRYPSLAWRSAANVRAGEIDLQMGRAEDGAARFVEVLDGEAPSIWTARARLGLATTLLWTREWREASRLLQQVVDAMAAGRPDADLAAASQANARLTLLHRIWLRAAAGEQLWDRAGRLPGNAVFDRPIGIAAGFDTILVTDEGDDQAIFIDAAGTAAPFSVADVQRPWWGARADGFVAAREQVGAPVRVESFQFFYPDGSRQRQLEDIRAGASTPDGGWLLLDNRFERVLRFGPDGGFQQIIDTGADGEPVDIARGPRGRLFVIERRRRAVVVFDAEGALSGGFALDDWRQPYAIALDAIGNAYVLERDLKRIDVFDSDGNFMMTLGPTLPSGVQLDDPRDLAVDGTGRILIADRGLRTVVVIE